MMCACDISVIVASDLQINIVQARTAKRGHKAKLYKKRKRKKNLLCVSYACLKRARVRIHRDFGLKTTFDE